MQRDYITILGIFASIIITFVAGIGVSGSVLNNIDKVSIYRLTFIILLLALFLSNLLNMLFEFIKHVRGHSALETNKSPSTIAGINALFLFLMLIDILLWAIYWYRATGYTMFWSNLWGNLHGVQIAFYVAKFHPASARFWQSMQSIRWYRLSEKARTLSVNFTPHSSQ